MNHELVRHDVPGGYFNSPEEESTQLAVDPRLTEQELAEFLPDSWVDWDAMVPDRHVDLPLDTLAETFKSGRPEVLLSEIHMACPELLTSDLPVPTSFLISISYARAEELIDGLGLRSAIEEAERWGHTLSQELALRARKQESWAGESGSNGANGSNGNHGGNGSNGGNGFHPSLPHAFARQCTPLRQPLIPLETLESRHDHSGNGNGNGNGDVSHITRRVMPMSRPSGGEAGCDAYSSASGAGDELFSLFGKDALHRLIAPMRPKYFSDDPESCSQIPLKAAFGLRKSLEPLAVFHLAIECEGIEAAAFFHGQRLRFHVVARPDLPLQLTEAALCEAYSLANTSSDGEGHETEVPVDHGRLVFLQQGGDCLAVWTQAREFAPGVHEKLMLILSELVASGVAENGNGG